MTGTEGQRLTFVERHELWSDEQREAARSLRKIVEEKKLETIRLSFADQHGILRGKTLIASEALASLESGCGITTSLLAKDTSHKTVFPVFTAGGGFGIKEMEGAADALMVPDPTTFRVLPWSPTSGWVLCDIYFGNGKPVPFSTRQLHRSVVNKLGERGYDFVAGLEVESHLFKLDDAHMAPEDRPASPARRRRSACCRTVINIWPSNASTRSSLPSTSSAAISSRSACPCARSRSNSARASASSPLRRRRASSPPTTWCCFAAP